MNAKQAIEELIANWSESVKHSKVTVFTKDKVLEIDHDFAPPVVREIKLKPKENKK